MDQVTRGMPNPMKAIETRVADLEVALAQHTHEDGQAVRHPKEPFYAPASDWAAAPTVEDQPPPEPNDLPHVADLVLADIAERKRVGIERYGTPLQPRNGRRALIDAYQEALDLVLYLRQAIWEQDNLVQTLEHLEERL